MKRFALTTVRAGPVILMTNGARIQVVIGAADPCRAIDTII